MVSVQGFHREESAVPYMRISRFVELSSMQQKERIGSACQHAILGHTRPASKTLFLKPDIKMMFRWRVDSGPLLFAYWV